MISTIKPGEWTMQLECGPHKRVQWFHRLSGVMGICIHDDRRSMRCSRFNGETYGFDHGCDFKIMCGWHLYDFICTLVKITANPPKIEWFYWWTMDIYSFYNWFNPIITGEPFMSQRSGGDASAFAQPELMNRFDLVSPWGCGAIPTSWWDYPPRYYMRLHNMFYTLQNNYGDMVMVYDYI